MNHGARSAFLRRLIDDAGLFPPAQLPMSEALAEDLAARAGPHAYALGRFICPASRIDEFVANVPQGMRDVALSVVCDGAAGADWYGGLKRDLARGESIAAATAGRARLDAIEVRLPEGDEGLRMLARLGDDRFAVGGQLQVFLEVPLGADWEYRVPRTLARIAEGGYHAKLRCGGLRAEAFPTPAQVARFISAARDHKVRIKATAGLHHPIRHVAPDSGFPMHGFLNVVGAAILTHAYDWDIPAIEQIIWDEEPGNFTLDEDAFGWHEYRVDGPGIEAARGARFDAYGSCSFKEPIDDLMALNIL